MKPVIGIPLRYQALKDGRPIVYMIECVRRTIQSAGGIVYPIVPVQDVDYFYTKGNEFPEITKEEICIIDDMLNFCDGILFPGGIKFTPFDRYILEQAIEKKIPVFGICLGMQMMSCYNEDINLNEIDSDINHKQELDEGYSHEVNILKGSKLYEILGVESLKVNSFHKYCVTKNNIYKISAISSDRIIEAIEYPSDVFNIGVQWHPEISYSFDDNSKKIIDAFIKASYNKACSKNKAIESVVE